MHWQHRWIFLTESTLVKTSLLNDFLQLLIIVVVSESSHETTSAKECSCLPFKCEKGHSSDQEEPCSVQWDRSHLTDLTIGAILAHVACSIELTADKDNTCQPCSYPWREDPLDKQKWQEPRELLNRIAMDPLCDVKLIPVLVRK